MNNKYEGKGIILYQSKYGATKKYADWIREETNFDMIETKKASIKDVLNYDTIILAGGVYASGIAGFGFIKRNIDKLKDKQIIVFCDGASPYDEKAIDEAKKFNFKNGLENIPLIYGRGAWHESKLKFMDKTLCKMLHKSVSAKDPATYEVWEKALMESMGSDHDFTDRKYLEPLFALLRKA